MMGISQQCWGVMKTSVYTQLMSDYAAELLLLETMTIDYYLAGESQDKATC